MMKITEGITILQKKYLESGKYIEGCNRNIFSFVCLGHINCYIENVFFSKKKEQNLEKKIEDKMRMQEVASGVVRVLPFL